MSDNITREPVDTNIKSESQHSGSRPTDVKKAGRLYMEQYEASFTFDFHTNKKIIDEIASKDFPSKRKRNQIAGFISYLVKKKQRITIASDGNQGTL